MVMEAGINTYSRNTTMINTVGINRMNTIVRQYNNKNNNKNNNNNEKKKKKKKLFIVIYIYIYIYSDAWLSVQLLS